MKSRVSTKRRKNTTYDNTEMKRMTKSFVCVYAGQIHMIFFVHAENEKPSKSDVCFATVSCCQTYTKVVTKTR
jgi:hypothetical protein